MDGAVVVVASVALGVLVGAFLNVAIDRVPDKQPLHGPRDGEPATPISWLGVPAQPWLLRGGRSEGELLPRAWLAVEVVTALLFGVFAGRYHAQWALVPYLLLIATLVAISAVDLRHLRIPDRITFPALAAAAPLLLLASVGDDRTDAIAPALFGAVLYFVLLLVPHLIYPNGMGFGDVKLALLMGLYLGWAGWTPGYPFIGPMRLVFYALMAGCVIGVVFGGLAQIVTGKRGAFPFGPALALGCLLILYYAPELRF